MSDGYFYLDPEQMANLGGNLPRSSVPQAVLDKLLELFDPTAHVDYDRIEVLKSILSEIEEPHSELSPISGKPFLYNAYFDAPLVISENPADTLLRSLLRDYLAAVGETELHPHPLTPMEVFALLAAIRAAIQLMRGT